MLLELRVSQFAVIEELRLSLQPGLTVLTGEMGAGKSLLVDALAALLGGRVTQEAVRTGASSARVEGVFDCPPEDAGLGMLLQENGLREEGGVLILSREFTIGGRSVARINSRAVPVSLLREVGAYLVDIHGQTEHLSLLDSRRHLDFLDAFGGLLEQRREFGVRVAELRRLQQELEGLRRDDAEHARYLELLRFQVGEIQAARLQPEEEETLLQEREVLANTQMLQQGVLTAYGALARAEDLSAADLVEQAKGALKDAAQVDAVLQPHLESLEEMAINLEETARALRAYVDAIEANPARQAEVEERLDFIARLRHKYGSSVDEVLTHAQRGEEELAQAESLEERCALLEEKIASLEGELGLLADRLSQGREETLRLLEAAVRQELGELQMEHVRFAVHQDRQVALQGLPLPDGQRYAFSATGVDRVEILLSANPGEVLRPLARIASGGETSRLMLALKSALQRADPVPTLVFDEIEMGVGGRGGDVVGRKLWSLAGGRQVLCITHLPQVACYGDTHLRVAKEVVLDRSFTQVEPLQGEARLDEMAAMLGGASDRLRESARELLGRARAWKGRHGGA